MSRNRPFDVPSPPGAHENLQIPDGAINLFPHKLGARIFYVPSRQCILKAGSFVSMSEAEAMRFISKNTTVPVPQVHDAHVEDGVGYIFMSKLPGQPLGKVWPELSKEQRTSIAAQLRSYVMQWQSFRGNYFGALEQQPCREIFFHHLCLLPPYERQYGPYFSRDDYNEGLVEAIVNSRPKGESQLGEKEMTFIEKIRSLTGDTAIFTHGDLHLENILVNDEFIVTGIIDWGMAGYSFEDRDYAEARIRARDPDWIETLHEIFGSTKRINIDLYLQLDAILVEYSGL